MGKGFGQLGFIRGVIQYSLSPFEQRAFAGMLSKGFPNTLRRIAESSIRIVPPFVITYLIYDQTEKYHNRLMRKNPEDYVDDK